MDLSALGAIAVTKEDLARAGKKVVLRGEATEALQAQPRTGVAMSPEKTLLLPALFGTQDGSRSSPGRC